MIKQFFSEEYVDDVETTSLINRLCDYLKDDDGMIFYKFPSIKEFDKPVTYPDVFIVSTSIGVMSILRTCFINGSINTKYFFGTMSS